MARPCTICRHPKRSEIDAALVAGVPYRSVAQQFDAGPDAVNRHKAHIPAALAKAQEAAEVAQADDLLAEVKRLKTRADDLGTKAEKAGDLATALRAVREMREVVELLAKLRGELETGNTVHVHLAASPEWIAVRTRLLRALEPFPEARAAISEALANG